MELVIEGGRNYAAGAKEGTVDNSNSCRVFNVRCDTIMAEAGALLRPASESFSRFAARSISNPNATHH